MLVKAAPDGPQISGNFEDSVLKIFGSNFISVYFKLILQIDILAMSFEIWPKWVSQNHIGSCFGAIRHQAIARVNADPDLCHHITLLGHYELTDLKKECSGNLWKNAAASLDCVFKCWPGGMNSAKVISLGLRHYKNNCI